VSLQIQRVTTDEQLHDFVKLPWCVYHLDPLWAPPLFSERLTFCDKRKNPFFEHAEADYFLARRDGRLVGSIAAILNHRHNDCHRENVAHFGFFETLPDPQAAALLLEVACNWARNHGLSRMLGPMNFSTNDECGLLIDGFDTPPTVMLTYNPPYYRDYLEAASFRKAMDLLAWERNIAELLAPEGLPAKLQRVIGKVRDRYPLTIRRLNMNDWANEIERVKEIYNRAWQKNWGFVPMTAREIERLANNLKPILDPYLIFLVEREGQPVGFSLALPDVNELLVKLRPGPSHVSAYLAGARLIANKSKVKRVRVVALGVIEAYRGKGVDALLYYTSVYAAAERGYEWGEGSWILETNDAMNRPIQLLGSRLSKRFRIFAKELD
jgi:GNAT superfamily N-acetyltransferase